MASGEGGQRQCSEACVACWPFEEAGSVGLLVERSGRMCWRWGSGNLISARRQILVKVLGPVEGVGVVEEVAGSYTNLRDKGN